MIFIMLSFSLFNNQLIIHGSSRLSEKRVNFDWRSQSKLTHTPPFLDGECPINPPASKLILIEGIPGSGKTTAAQFVANWLQNRAYSTALSLEGDLDHPADFESVACLDEDEYNALVRQFPAYQDLIDWKARLCGSERFYSYRKLQMERDDLPVELI